MRDGCETDRQTGHKVKQTGRQKDDKQTNRRDENTENRKTEPTDLLKEKDSKLGSIVNP